MSSSEPNPNHFQISTTITMEKIWLVANEFIVALRKENFSGQIKPPGPVLLTKLKWDQYNIKMKIFMELIKDWRNSEYGFKFIAAVSGVPQEAERGDSEDIFYISSFSFDMKMGEKWESDDATDIALGKFAQDLTEVEFGFSEILNNCDVAIAANCQRQKKNFNIHEN